MTRGVSIHVGLNEVDPNHYVDENGNPWDGRLYACEADAAKMAELATGLGYEVRPPLLSQQATVAAVSAALEDVAQGLEPGDALLITYSGHGGQVENTNPRNDPEPDNLDETWCLFDRQMLDDELFALFSKFRPGVRIVMFSDSCHSGTVTRGQPPQARQEAIARQLPVGVSIETEKRNKATYEGAQANVPAEALTQMPATVALISGCLDHQYSYEARGSGVFTSALLRAWQMPEARRSLSELHKHITEAIPGAYDQTPKHTVYSFDVGPALII